MTERFPLSVSSTDPFERALLGSVRRDQPGPQALPRTATALGLGASAILSVGNATGAIGTAVKASGVAAASLPWVVVKAVAIGALCGSVAIVGVRVANPTGQVTTPPSNGSSPLAGNKVSTEASRIEPSTAQRDEPVPVATVAQDLPHPSEYAVVKGLTRPPAAAQPAAVEILHTFREVTSHLEPPAVRLPAAAVATTAADVARPSVASTATIAEEIASIDRARLAIRTGKAREALSELERYQARWPGGVFAMECIILRVEAKLALGDRAGAERDASVILKRQPNGRYAARLRALVGSTTNGDAASLPEP